MRSCSLCPSIHGWSAPCHVPCSQRVPSTCHSGDGTLGVFNVKRRRFDLVSEPQNGDLTSVVLMKVGTAPPAWSRIPLPRSCSEFSVSLPSLVPRGGGRWLVAPAKAPSTSSTGTASGLPATALRSGQRPLTAWCPSRTASSAWAPWTESSGQGLRGEPWREGERRGMEGPGIRAAVGG